MALAIPTPACRSTDKATKPKASVFLLSAVLLMTLTFWASAFVAIPIALTGFAPEHVAVGRQVISMSLVLPMFLYWGGERVGNLFKSDWKLLLIFAVLGFFAYHLALSTGQRSVGPATASLVVNIGPIFTGIFAAILLNERLGRRGWAGAAIAFSGAAGVVLSRDASVRFDPNVLWVFAATISQAISFVVQRQLNHKYPALMIGAAGICVGALLLLPFGSGLISALSAADSKAVAALLFLGAGTGVLPYLGWGWILAQMPASRASLWLFLVPIIATGLGWAILDQAPTLQLIGFGALTLLGVTVATAGSRRNAPKGEEIFRDGPLQRTQRLPLGAVAFGGDGDNGVVHRLGLVLPIYRRREQ